MTMRTALRSAAVSVAAVVLLVPATGAEAHTWHRRYYDNYFYTEVTCLARGEGVTGKPWGAGDAIPGAIRYHCYQQRGQSKWTMDILFHFSIESW